MPALKINVASLLNELFKNINNEPTMNRPPSLVPFTWRGSIITENDLCFPPILMSQYAVEQGLIKYIDAQGRVHTAETPQEVVLQSVMENTVKIEGYENLSPRMFKFCRFMAERMHNGGPVTAHLFISPKDSASFDRHTDPDDVLLYVVSGMKEIQLDGIHYLLPAGTGFFIPANTPHQVFNPQDSIMLSFGLEKYLLEKVEHATNCLHENNGSLQS